MKVHDERRLLGCELSSVKRGERKWGISNGNGMNENKLKN